MEPKILTVKHKTPRRLASSGCSVCKWVSKYIDTFQQMWYTDCAVDSFRQEGGEMLEYAYHIYFICRSRCNSLLHLQVAWQMILAAQAQKRRGLVLLVFLLTLECLPHSLPNWIISQAVNTHHKLILCEFYSSSGFPSRTFFKRLISINLRLQTSHIQ